jgi:hypothetical protein
MDVLHAHELFARREDRSALDVVDGVFIQAPDGSDVDCWPAGATAAVMLAGMLDDAKTEKDLDEGLAHFDYLYRDGIVSRDEWTWLIASIVHTIYVHCASLDDELEPEPCG